MNIRIGDIVRFISEKMEGKVTGIIDNTTVNIFVDDYGFEIPASTSDLVVIHSDFTPSKPDSSSVTQVQKGVTMESGDTLYFAIVPDNFNNLPDSRYELFLVNDTQQTCLYSIAFRHGEKYSGISAGNCNPDSTCPIGTYSLKDIDAGIKAVHIQAIFFKKGSTTPRTPIEAEVKINTVNLCKSGIYKHTRWFDSICIIRALDKEHLPATEEIDEKQLTQAIREKKDTTPAPTPRPQKQIVGNIVEIDLHCHELLETTAGMNNKDILEYQLEVFRKTMEEYKLRKGQKIVFIHGKGDGILRQRILWELQTKYKRHHHQDALTIGGAEQDIRPVACLLIQVHKKRVAVGIQRFRRGHVNDRLPPQLPAGQPHPLRQRMPGIQRRHQPHLLGQQPVHPFILLQVGAVPGQDQIKLIPQKSRRQLVGGAAVKGDQQIGVPLVEFPQEIGKSALLIAL